MDNMTFESLGILMGLSKDENQAFIGCVFDRLTAGVERLSLFPGIRRILKRLSKDHVLAVVTANSEEGVLKLLANKGLSKHISAVAGRDQNRSKSDRIRALMKRFAVQRKWTYLIGDTVSDIVEARAARVNSVAVTWGFQARWRLLREGPDFVLERPEEIADLLEERAKVLNL